MTLSWGQRDRDGLTDELGNVLYKCLGDIGFKVGWPQKAAV